MRTITALMLAGLSCTAQPPAEPPPKDWSPAYPAVLEKLPSDAYVVAVADLGHTIERLSALRRVVLSAPTVKRLLQPKLTELESKVGWDLFDPKAWEGQGMGPHAAAAFVMANAHPWLVFTGSEKLGPVLEKQMGPGMKCSPAGGLLACGDEGQSLPEPAGSTLWSAISESVPQEVRKMDLLAFAPLAKVAQKEDLPFLRASKSAWLGLRTSEREVRITAGYLNPEWKDVEKYLRLAPNTTSVLGATHGTDGAVRMTFSPTALWGLAKEKLPPKELNQVSGAFAMMTGLDLEQDIVNNLTGEIVGAMTDRGMALYIGARDDKRTEKLLEKLDNLAAGAIEGMKSKPQLDMKFERSVDQVKGVKAYHYKLHIPAEMMKLPQPFDYEMHFAAGRGAIVWGFDRGSLESGLAGLGRPLTKFLDELPPSARARFEANPVMAGYFRSIDPAKWMNHPFMGTAKATYDKISPDLWPIVLESMNLWELIWDGDSFFDVRDGKAELDYVVRFL